MKTIGILGGMSWESSVEYYRIINRAVQRELGGLHSAKSLMFSFDFAEIEDLQHAGRWDEATASMVAAARDVERGGADLLLIATNTMHRMADEVQAAIDIPLIHIADATAEAIIAQGIRTIGLLGTRYTMEEDFYAGRLRSKHGLEVLVPLRDDRTLVHEVIYNELCLGITKDDSRARYREIINSLVAMGAEGVILGCTEIMLLIGQDDSPVPVFDTTTIHAEAAVRAALS